MKTIPFVINLLQTHGSWVLILLVCYPQNRQWKQIFSVSRTLVQSKLKSRSFARRSFTSQTPFQKSNFTGPGQQPNCLNGQRQNTIGKRIGGRRNVRNQLMLNCFFFSKRKKRVAQETPVLNS